jgi:PAS domain S-box-containing protein
MSKAIASTPGALAAGDLRALASFDELNCGLIASTVDGTIIAINHRLLAWLEYEEHEVLGGPTEGLVPSELRAILREERRSVQDGDLRARLMALRRKNGTTFPAISLPHRFLDGEGKVLGGLSVIIDLATVQTAKRLGGGGEYDLATRLQSMALELEALGLAAQMPGNKPVPLAHPALKELSPREKEVLVHLVAGERVATIGEKLFISPHTVRNHLKNMFSKLEVSSQPELIALVHALQR